MDFQPRTQALTEHELRDIVSISPDEDVFSKGFALPESQVEDVVRAVKDLEGCRIVAHPDISADNNVELLLRTVRLLQLGLEIHTGDNELLVKENNELREELRVHEEENRDLQDDNNQLRQQLDGVERGGDVRELRQELQDTRRALEDEKRQMERAVAAADQDRRELESLDARLARATEDIARRDEEVAELREALARMRDDLGEALETADRLKAEQRGADANKQLGDTIRQQDWKIEQLSKGNTALTENNKALVEELDNYKEEVQQVSQKIVLLDDELRAAHVRESDLEARAETLSAEKAALLQVQEELRAEVQDKMALLDEFEDKFNRQYRSWEEEQNALRAQLEATRRDARLYTRTRSRPGQGAADDGDAASEALEDGADLDDELVNLKAELDEAREKEVLLLEAYEQLERDVGAEVDRALGVQREEVSRLGRRVQYLEGSLGNERQHSAALEEQAARIEQQLRDALARNSLYESGVYGLPQAALEIRQLKDAAAADDAKVKQLIQHINKLSATVEDLNDENQALRQQLGTPAGHKVDIAGVKLQKEITIAQLRSVNALLERQVSDLEEERRKLRHELKFRAKYHGKAALEMGLNSEQLLLLEQYVDGLKYGRNPDANLVAQMQKRVEFLEVRLAEVMAYADIPVSMRPALSELDAAGGGTSALPPGSGALPALPALSAGLSWVKVTQIELVREGVLAAQQMLQEMSQSLAESRQVSDTEYKQFLQGVMNKMGDTEQLVGRVIKDMAAATAATTAANNMHRLPSEASEVLMGGGAGGAGRSAAQQQQQQHLQPMQQQLMQILQLLQQQQQQQRHQDPSRPQTPSGTGNPGSSAIVGGMDSAAAVELQSRLGELARSVVDLQMQLAHKDAQLEQLLGGGTAGGAAAASRHGEALRQLHKRGVMDSSASAAEPSREEQQSETLDSQSLRVQLIECLEELATRETELAEAKESCLRHQTRMQQLSDQVKMLYRDHAAAAAAARADKASTDKKIQKLSEDADGYKAAHAELQQALDKLHRAQGPDDIRTQYVDTVRRISIVQIKHAKIARQLEASQAAERSLRDRLLELEEELRDVSSTCRSRMRWLQMTAADAARRAEQLFGQLQASAPLEAYQSLCQRHRELQQEHRQLVERTGDSASGTDELARAREALAALTLEYDAACNTLAEFREKARQLEQQASAGDVQDGVLMLQQELVQSRVAQDNQRRRLEMEQKEKGRVLQTLQEMQDRLTEMEDRLAQATGELSTTRSMEARLRQRLQGARPQPEVDELQRRLAAAEATAGAADSRQAELILRAEEAERKLQEVVAQRHGQLADVTDLRAALRDMAGHSDHAAALARMAQELEHVRAKEALMRGSLNRSELERLELERQLRAVKQQATQLSAGLAIQQDHAAWAERELRDAHSRLEGHLASRTEAWKTAMWARKLTQLRGGNEGMAVALERALGRARKAEEARAEAEGRMELAQDVESLLSKSAAECHREVAALRQQLLQLKLEAGRLRREEVLLREKVTYTERVNGELSALLEGYDEEAFRQQAAAEAQHKGTWQHVRQLQEEVSRLQERITTLLAEKEAMERSGARHGATAAALAASAGQQLQPSGGPPPAAAAFDGLADQELMLRHIESVKQARQEAEHLRHECRRLEAAAGVRERQMAELQAQYNEVLGQLKQSSQALVAALGGGGAGSGEAALGQMKAVAEAAVQELQARLRDKDAQLAALQLRLESQQQSYLAQHQADRAEVAELQGALMRDRGASIAELRGTLSRTSQALALHGDGREEVPYEQLRAQLEERTAEVEVLKHRVEQKDAALEGLRANYEEAARELRAELAAARAALDARPRHDDTAAPSRATLQKLHAQLKLKDERLRQLKEAVKQLEGRLIDVLKKDADGVMQASSWKEQERIDERIHELERDNALLLDELDRCRADLQLEARLRQMGAEAPLEQEAVAQLRAELARERAKQSPPQQQQARGAGGAGGGGGGGGGGAKSKRDPSVEAANMAVLAEAKRKVEELQKRILVLERQNHQLRLAIKQDEVEHGGATSTAARPGSPPKCPAQQQQQQQQQRSDPQVKTRSMRPDDASSAAGGRTASPSAADPESIANAAAAAQPGSSGSGEAAAEPAQAAGSARLSSEEASAGPRGTSVEQWTEQKRLAARLEALRKRLAAKTEECDKLQQELDKKSAVIQNLQAENSKLAKLAKRSGAAAGASKAAEAPATPTAADSKLRDYVQRVMVLEDERDRLRLQLDKLQRMLQPHTPPSADAGTKKAADDKQALSKELGIFELTLQRDQARAAVERLRARLMELFADRADGVGGTGSVVAAAGTTPGVAAAAATAAGAPDAGAPRTPDVGPPAQDKPARPGSAVAKTKLSGLTGREAELIATIENLQAALQHAMQTATPNTKHQQEVARRREAQREAQAATAQVATLKEQLATVNTSVAELQAGSAELRQQVRQLQQRLGTAAQKEQDAGQQSALLAAALRARDGELQALQQRIASAEEQLRQQGGRSAKAEQERATAQHKALLERVAQLQSQNEDLKAELSAFDPAFFEEIEDLKHEHHQLGQKCLQHEQTIQLLRQQLRASGRGQAAR